MNKIMSIALLSYVAYIANSMDSDQTAYAANIKNRQHFQDKNIGGIRVIMFLRGCLLHKCISGTRLMQFDATKHQEKSCMLILSHFS